MAAINGSATIISSPAPGSSAAAATPSSSSFVQVGGHPGTVEATADGAFVIKHAKPSEHAFYDILGSTPALAGLREWVPHFWGTLRLEGVMRPDGALEPAPAVGATGTESLVLENLGQYFVKGNVMDVKLGRVLWDESASPEKRQRMEMKARTTTSGETGVRLTGFNVYDRRKDGFDAYKKPYGYALTVSQLPSGMSTFFPCASTSSDVGLPPDFLLAVLQGVEDDIEELLELLQTLEIRMVGASVLIYYEGQEDALREALKRQDELQTPTDSAVGAGDDDEEDDDKDEDEDMDEEEETPRLPWIVRLIDFAHTRLATGEGPDEGVLFGLRTLLGLLRGRRREVERLAGAAGAGRSI